MESPLQSRARHLLEVEGLSLTQTARALGVSRKKITRLVRQNNLQRKPRESIIAPYEGLIGQWYGQYPFLQAIQVLERLRPYGYEGGYSAVKRYTRQFRTRRPRESFHELSYLPGEESQVDWMHWNTPFGVVYGFVYLLAYSRYLYVTFYLRSSMEFFLDGHIGAFKEIGGVAQRHKYDNLKSVVISRKPPSITYNARFMDFARYYGFKVHACTPVRANEKGRVERAIRDIENGFLRVESFSDLAELNRKVSAWRISRNNREHRSTGKAPSQMLKEEKLKVLPRTPYQPYRNEPALISKTGFVTVDTNRYSVPSGYCGQHCDLLIYPWQIEVLVGEKKIARHDRRFDRHQKIEHPGHRRGLLERTPHFKRERIYQLMKGMDASIERFLAGAHEEGQDPFAVAYELFKLLKGVSKGTLISAVREANGIPAYKTSFVRGLLSPAAHDNPVHPQNTVLLSIDYEGRSLDDYDTLI